MDWIRDLIVAEQKMEESGVIDISEDHNAEEILREETLDYIKDLKAGFIESSSAFNELKGSSLGQIKIYGISKTVADFMLFRNGFKLIFSIHSAGRVTISFANQGTSFTPDGVSSNIHENLLEAKWGAFGQLKWFYKSLPVDLDYLIRYYLTRFIKESAK